MTQSPSIHVYVGVPCNICAHMLPMQCFGRRCLPFVPTHLRNVIFILDQKLAHFTEMRIARIVLTVIIHQLLFIGCNASFGLYVSVCLGISFCRGTRWIWKLLFILGLPFSAADTKVYGPGFGDGVVMPRELGNERDWVSSNDSCLQTKQHLSPRVNCRSLTLGPKQPSLQKCLTLGFSATQCELSLLTVFHELCVSC